MLNRDTLGLIESREGSHEQGKSPRSERQAPPKIRYEKEKCRGKETDRFTSN